MPVCLDFRRIRSRLQDMAVFRRKEKKCPLKIVSKKTPPLVSPSSLTICSQSAPFNFKKETTSYLPGITESE
jgi:hypothetical protein